MSYPVKQKRALIHAHAATVFEDVCRAQVPGAQRYWESGVEFDLVAPDPLDADRLVVAEVKWRRVTAAERRRLLATLAARWSRSTIGARHPHARFEVMDASLFDDATRHSRGRTSRRNG
jgi:hypothetical protein